MKKSKKKKELIELDPIFPLPAGTGLPSLKQGQGEEIGRSTSPTRVVELPYRAFYLIWELTEAKARGFYPQHTTGPLAHWADAYLEAVTVLRSAELETPLEPFSEERATKLRKRWEKAQKQAAKAKKGVKGKKTKRDISETTSKATETVEDIAEDLCGAKHKAPDGKKRKCIRMPGHNGKHKDRKNNRW